MHDAMRPLGFGEILDGAFTLLRRHFAVFFGTALLPQIPIVLFWLVVPALVGPLDGGTFLSAAPLLLMPYNFLATVVIMGALTEAAGVAYSGRNPRIGAALGRGLRRFLPMAVVSVLGSMLFGLGLVFLIVPGLIVIAMFFAIYPVVMLEDRGPLDAFGRSRNLSRGARMRILGVLVVALLITYLPVMAMWMFAGVGLGIGAAINAATTPGASLWFMSLMQAASIVISSVTLPFLITVTVLLYYDRRARTEAPDLESAVAELQDNAV